MTEAILWSELARYRKGPEDKPDPTEATFESLVGSVFERVKGQIEEEEEGGIEVLRSEVAETIGRMGLRFPENFWDRCACIFFRMTCVSSIYLLSYSHKNIKLKFSYLNLPPELNPILADSR